MLIYKYILLDANIDILCDEIQNEIDFIKYFTELKYSIALLICSGEKISSYLNDPNNEQILNYINKYKHSFKFDNSIKSSPYYH